MSWVGALSWLACAGIAVCFLIIGYCALYDRSLRGSRRVSNGRVRREQITVSLPNNWLRDFSNREYHDE